MRAIEPDKSSPLVTSGNTTYIAMVNINAMRAIVKHNVFKQLKQLSESDQTKINDFIHCLSLNELKKERFGIRNNVYMQTCNT